MTPPPRTRSDSPARHDPSPTTSGGRATGENATALAAPQGPVLSGCEAGRVGHAPAPHGRPDRPTTPDLQFAGYLLARQVTGRPLATAAKVLLQGANVSKKRVLHEMEYGRANVTADLAVTGNAGYYRVLAQRHAVGSTSSLGESPLVTSARDAALAAHVGCGNCGEFALVAAHVHAARLQPGERLMINKAAVFDHSWVIIDGRASPGGSVPHAVLDLWADGPVIEPCDGAFTGPESEGSITLHTIGHDNAATASQQFERILCDPGPKVKQRLDNMIAAHTARAPEPSGTIYDPMPVVSEAFCDEARQAVQTMQVRGEATNLNGDATALLREIAGTPEPGAEGDALVQRVIDFAENLRKTPARHLTEPPSAPPKR